jgi:short-subunit dehydrogenase
MDYRGQRALITGASSGLGAEFAKQLAGRGADLLLTARTEPRLRALAESLAREHNVAAEIIPCDLGATGGAKRLCEEVARRGLRIDHLISNAGFGDYGPVEEADPEQLDEMVRLNCEALVHLSRHFVPAMVRAQSGGIVHVASIAGLTPIPYMATYAATKAFVAHFSLALAEEVRDAKVRVLAVCPGPVQTGFQKRAGGQIAPSQRRAVLSAEDVVRRSLSAYERGRELYVPGGLNRLAIFGAQLIPRRLQLWATGRMMRQRAQDPKES